MDNSLYSVIPLKYHQIANIPEEELSFQSGQFSDNQGKRRGSEPEETIEYKQ